MKKVFKRISLLCLGLIAFCGIGLGIYHSNVAINEPSIVLAEGEEEVITTGTVIIEKTTHGTVEASITSGNVGDICVLTVKHDLLYKIGSVSVNGVALIESETTSGEYSFALIAGENKVVATFIVDEELFGVFTTMVEQANNKDWTHLFSVENIIIIIKWVLDGGILIALIRYYVKDKKLEKALENKVQETIEKIIPDSTKQTVISSFESVITPLFSQITADNIELKKAMSIFAKCMALSQENTPDSRRAILDELSGLRISDLNTIEDIKKYIETLVAQHQKAYEETMAAINHISEKNKEIIEQPKKEEKQEEIETQVKKEENTYDGTSI